MTVMTPKKPQLSTLLLVVGSAIVLISAVVEFLRAFTMDDSMPGMDTAMPAGGMPVATDPLHGMPLSEMPGMWLALAGLVLVVAGAVLRRRTAQAVHVQTRRGRITLAVIGTTALTIDISKTSTLGFVIPGMRMEYGLEAGTASLLAVFGLAGTATGAVLFGLLADHIGRRSSYLIATLGFTATSMCGMMPTFAGNVIMCALMGVSVGGLAPLLITMLTETVGGHRAGSVVALSVLATAVGYLVASGTALWLEPMFGWRVLWLIGAPTGLVLVLLTPLVPHHVRQTAAPMPQAAVALQRRVLSNRLQFAFAFLIGMLTFGLTTWVPSLARVSGTTANTANLLLTGTSLVMVPCSVALMLCYRKFGPVRIAVALATATGLLLFALASSGVVSAIAGVGVVALAAALFAVNTLSAVFLPIAADLADASGRGRTTGVVSLFNRLGGLCGPLLLAGLVSSTSDVLIAVAVLATLCGVTVFYIGRRQSAVQSAG